ncbi:hypothetical protein [Myxococcus qinghaiensis]|uniref:hypothetical protein n=1 Tax=Myxococcus qinghaiensis TaxID=2906758 RepID=UPI0020A70DAD|nr:hypothetical protein [Myxococcus qinghaiensis]MCP3166399.1 hypothetical protein [Myxococcus qinghaiensis]
MFKQSVKLVCAVALVLGGCGGAPEQLAVEETEVIESTEQALIWACDGTRAFNRYWYVNNVEVGREYCDCPSSLNQFGEQRGRYTQEHIAYCAP